MPSRGDDRCAARLSPLIVAPLFATLSCELAVRVSRDGSLRLPRLGQIPANGRRLFELKAEIAKRAVRLTPEPEVHLWLVDESRAARSR